ncbi:glycoside hydrolase family 79 protein [Lentinula aff. lateritia]|uniref:Glycoside hydrolase family 79 protein n=1 Tax=Lentinula aff. lateritia TaxID=2804960 RepID=A0ACC1TWD8_9AGAR|nr:glycoside hydrolase family 79 protein [Lentinula aff. lateritia]
MQRISTPPTSDSHTYINVVLPPADNAVTISPSFSGTTSSHQFFYNAMENLKNLTGSSPPPFPESELTFPAPNPTTPYPEANNISVGDNTEVIWGVDFGRNNLTAAIVETTSIMQAFSGPEVAKLGISLKFLEIGNEPDLYMNNGLRPKNYNVTQYVSDAFAGSSSNFKGFSLQAIFNLYKVPLRFSKHTLLPRGTFCSGSEGVLSDLMSKANIRGNLSQYASDIKATNDQGFDYDDSTALTRSISDGFPLSAPLPPYIQPQYYAGIVAAQAIGPYGNTLISELTIDNPQISGYAFYDDSQVKRILINHTHHMHSDDTSGLTWSGQSYETSDGLIGGFVSAGTVALNEYLSLVAFQCS